MKKHNVMMVDDDTFTNELATMVINWSSFSSQFCVMENAHEALRHLKDLDETHSINFPDFILLDINMPEMNGFDFIREFEGRFPDKKDKTHFIITTSSILKKDKKEALSFNSVVDYIIKPIPGDFIEKLIVQGVSRKKQLNSCNN